MFKLICTLVLSLGFSINANAANDIRLGLTYLPQVSLPGAKVRTAGAIELLAIEQKIDNLKLVSAKSAVPSLAKGEIDSWVGVLDQDTELPEFLSVNKLEWSASPVMIMRSDTDIKSWDDLRNRTVCVSKDNRFIGEVEHRYAAIEDIYPTVTDALLALRTGECDASLQEESFVNQLLEYPEWQKFSARLQPYKHINLVELQLAENSVDRRLIDLFSAAQLENLVKDQAQDIAFEVYLDQTVPDCH